MACECGVPYAAELLAFVDAVLTGSAEEIDCRRRTVTAVMGHEALSNAAAVIGNFQRMNRIADAMGIELDTMVEVLASPFQEKPGFANFHSASHSKSTGRFTRLLGTLLYRIVMKFFRPPG